ncbi:RelA/SpoT family protein [Patescibacteria group bacterium]|nr:RelA/SpoT family protein [Patescibacteria group bacterium]MBU2633596.1 RelA/SpoT family protein [Patescibacteria group bacterium]
MDWEKYKEKLPKTYSEKDIALVKRAFDFASEIHKDEKRESGEPYITHPIAVSLEIATELELGPYTIAAALLHDTYEADNTVLDTIRKKFGEEVSFLVKGLTKVDKIEYHGAERSAESVRKMFMAMAQDIRVIIIKLFDRLHNLETLHALPGEKRERIARETLEIYAPVADRLGMGKIRLKIEDAAFKYAHPKEYEWLVKETREKVSEREEYLKKKVIPLLKKELQKEKISIQDIHYRAKHYYSLWKKLLRNNMDWYTIYDLAAVRIVVNSLEDCYAVLGIIHKFWKPLPGRIKDYIALPKQNGYKSLHTTVFCIDKKITEFQIRTLQMHEEAEQGIAAHWAWEMAGKPREIRKMPHQKTAWIKQLREWHKQFNKNVSSEDFLKSLKIDFFKDRIFVLTPKGDVIDLPEGATVVDFAYHIHSDIGNSISAAKINNHIVPLSYEPASGDIVEIFIQKNKKPNSKMLDYAKTPVAKSHIKSALKRRNFLSKFSDKKTEKIKTELNIIVEERIGIIKDIGTILSLFRINVESFITKETDNKYASITIAFYPKNKEQVDKIITRLKNTKGVEEVSAKNKETKH